MSPEKAAGLLDPADKQNVPKAVQLIQVLKQINSAANEPPGSTLPNAVDEGRQRTMEFLSQFFAFFVEPFITVEWSLSEQLKSLSVFSHLLAAMWLKHRTSFITAALYADAQAIIKNIFFTAARMQLIDEDAKFYIIHEGTDRLEGLFSDCRTQTHSRNFDTLQLSDNLSLSALVSFIFEHNPDIDRGHRRLNLSGAIGVDHINPKSWKGDVRVGQVDIPTVWASGREEATRILRELFQAVKEDAAHVDFGLLLARDGCDILRPDGEYVGLGRARDDDRTELPEQGSCLPELERPLHQDAAETSSDNPTSESLSSPDDVFDDEAEGLDVDQYFPDFISAPARPAPPNTNPTADPESVSGSSCEGAETRAEEDYLVVDGQKYLKDSLVASWLSSKRSQKVIIRMLRCRGVTVENMRTKENFDSTDFSSEDLIKCNDIAATLVHAHGSIALAVVIIIAFEKITDRTHRLASVTMDELERRGSGIQVVAQVLEMTRVNVGASHRVDSAQATGHDDPEAFSWEPTGQYLRLTPARGAAHSEVVERTSYRDYSVIVPGYFVHPLGPSLREETEDHSDSDAPGPDTLLGSLDPVGIARNDDAVDSPTTRRFVWSIPETQLEDVLECAWEIMAPYSEDIVFNISQLPRVEDSAGLPYQDSNGRATQFSRHHLFANTPDN